MTEPTRLWTLFGVAVYPYGIGVGLAALLASGLLCLLWRRKAHASGIGLRFALYAMPMTVLFARLGYLAVRLRFLSVDYVAGFWYQLSLGGFSLAGGSAGLLLAGWLFARRHQRPFAAVMDLAAPPALLALACIRLAEFFTLEGVGLYVDNEALWRFPFAVVNPYGEYVLPVFLYEAIVALLIGMAVLLTLRRARVAGNAALTAMLLLGLTQVLLESLRADDYLRFGFVRVNQLWGILLAGYAWLVWLRRARPTRARRGLAVTVCLICIGVMVAVEFGRDKSTIPNEALYLAMAVALTAVGAMGVALRNASARRNRV